MTEPLMQTTGLQAQMGIAKSQLLICSHGQKEGTATRGAVALCIRHLTADQEKTR